MLPLLLILASFSSLVTASTLPNPPSPLNYVDASKLQENLSYSPKAREHLPECASQQVCNALFVRMNHTQPLCDCGRNYNWQCSADVSTNDGHTIELTRVYDKKVYTQVKLCEPLQTVRTCKSPTDWTLLALQSERSGKAHYVVVCRCPDSGILEGPYTHDPPPYARISGIRVYGMLCSQPQKRVSKTKDKENTSSDVNEYPDFPWDHAYAVLNSTSFTNLW